MCHWTQDMVSRCVTEGPKTSISLGTTNDSAFLLLLGTTTRPTTHPTTTAIITTSATPVPTSTQNFLERPFGPGSGGNGAMPDAGTTSGPWEFGAAW